VARLPSIALRAHGGMPPSACVEHAVAAERAGLSTLWFAENPFTRGVWPAMAACAVATRRLRIGIGVFNPYNRHPSLMAMEMAAFDELSAGRAVLGIGAGIGTKVRKMQLANDRPIAAMRDAMTITRRLLHAAGPQTPAAAAPALISVAMSTLSRQSAAIIASRFRRSVLFLQKVNSSAFSIRRRP